MPRPGQSGGSRPSSGHSSSGRTSSGHRISSGTNNRPGFNTQNSGPSFSNRSSGSSRNTGSNWNRDPYQGYRRTPRMPYIPGMFSSRRRYSEPRYNDPYPYDGYNAPRQRGGMGSIIGFVVLVILVVLLLGMCGCSKKTDSIGASSYNREKLNNSTPFVQECIVDEEHWFDNITQTEKRLESFYDKTGVQPYIVINSYNPSLKTDEEKAQYARDWYDEHIPDETTFLYMYFPDKDPDEIGYMEAVNGKAISSVMDPEAVDIFWNVLDSNWRSNLSTDDLFVNTFNTTADRIMTKSATANDVTMRTLMIAGILVVIAGVVIVMIVRRRHEREKAQETERILNTPLRPEEKSNDDDLINRYGG